MNRTGRFMSSAAGLFLGILLGTLLLSGCEHLRVEGESVILRYKEADMPVIVRGNTDSRVFIIYLHGGPGGSSYIDIQNDFFAGIEEEYAMVCYDQRSSGNSQGQSDVSLLTLDQFVEDLEVVTDYIIDTYAPEHLFLLGHSWGGTLGTGFLLKEDNRNLYDGWIEVDGGHSLGQNAYEYSRDFVLTVAEEKLAGELSASDRSTWEGVIDYYDGLEGWRDTQVIIDHSGYVTLAGGYFYDQDKRNGLVPGSSILWSETNFLALLAQNEFVVTNMDVWHYDFTDRLPEIDIPVLLLWGRHDGILPVELCMEAVESYGLTGDEYYIFEETGHSPHYEQTALFNEKVVDFIESIVHSVTE